MWTCQKGTQTLGNCTQGLDELISWNIKTTDPEASHQKIPRK